MSEFKSQGGIARIVGACRYSAQGFSHALRHEAAFRQELLFAVPAVGGVWFLHVTLLEKIVLLASVVLVLIVELLNSAIEAVVDRVSLERHPLAGRAKDLGSAAVMLSIVFMLAAWVLLAGPAILAWFR
jgi:diacylglycerol kinase (ATP)